MSLTSNTSVGKIYSCCSNLRVIATKDSSVALELRCQYFANALSIAKS